MMRLTETDLQTSVASRVEASGTTHVWTAADFADLGNRNAIDKALQRLTKAGTLRRIERGLYDKPRLNALTRKPTPPDYRAVVDAIARRDQIRILVDGMTAANDLGLSDAVPGQVILHTDARLKPIHLGNLTLSFRPTSASKLYWADRPAMRLVQAMTWLKSQLETPATGKPILDRIAAILEDPRHGPALRQDLIDGLSALPAWLQDIVRNLLPAPARTAGASKRTLSRPA